MYDKGLYVIVRKIPNKFFELYGIGTIEGELLYIGFGNEKMNPFTRVFKKSRASGHVDDLIDKLLQMFPADFAIIHLFHNIPTEPGRYLESI